MVLKYVVVLVVLFLYLYECQVFTLISNYEERISTAGLVAQSLCFSREPGTMIDTWATPGLLYVTD